MERNASQQGCWRGFLCCGGGPCAVRLSGRLSGNAPLCDVLPGAPCRRVLYCCLPAGWCVVRVIFRVWQSTCLNPHACSLGVIGVWCSRIAGMPMCIWVLPTSICSPCLKPWQHVVSVLPLLSEPQLSSSAEVLMLHHIICCN